MKIAALQRSEFVKARDYQRKWDAYRKKLAAGEEAAAARRRPGSSSRWSKSSSANGPSTSTRIAPTTFMTVLRLAEEFGFELVVQHGTEGYKSPTSWPGAKCRSR